MKSLGISLFLAHVAANKSDVIAQLTDAHAWTLANDIRSEDRFSAWIIAVAKVAGEIARELGLIRFDVLQPLRGAIRRVEILLRQSKRTVTGGNQVGTRLLPSLSSWVMSSR